MLSVPGFGLTGPKPSIHYPLTKFLDPPSTVRALEFTMDGFKGLGLGFFLVMYARQQV